MGEEDETRRTLRKLACVSHDFLTLIEEEGSTHVRRAFGRANRWKALHSRCEDARLIGGYRTRLACEMSNIPYSEMRRRVIMLKRTVDASRALLY